MHRRLITLLTVCVVCLSFIACKKDAAFETAITDIHTTTDEIVKKINASPTVAGVDEAQKYWDSKKADLKKKWDDIKDARGFQVSKETKTKFEESYAKDYTAIKNLEIKHMRVSIRDAEFKSRLEKLIKEWEDTLSVKK